MKKPSIFHRIWKSNRRRVFLLKSMSFFKRWFNFKYQWNIDKLSVWNFVVNSMANQRRYVYWIIANSLIKPNINYVQYIKEVYRFCFCRENFKWNVFHFKKNRFLHRIHLILAKTERHIQEFETKRMEKVIEFCFRGNKWIVETFLGYILNQNRKILEVRYERFLIYAPFLLSYH